MNILIVGLGSIANKHIAAIRELLSEYKIVALRSGKGGVELPDITNIYSLDRIHDYKIDFAIISNPTSEHKNTISALLEYNIPLFIEKPLYYDLDLKEILDTIVQKDILTYVACNLRFLDCIRFIKKEIEGRRINEVNVYCGSYMPSWREKDYKQTYSSFPELGGGVHLDLIHELDYIYWFFGVPLRTESLLRNRSSLGISAVDYANYCLVFDSFSVGIVLNYYRKDYKRTCEIVFEETTWLINLNENKISSPEGLIFSSDQKISDTYFSQMEYFLNLIKRGERNTFNTALDGFNVLKICLANDIKE